MKKELNKIILFIGFLVVVVGAWIVAFDVAPRVLVSTFSLPMIAAVLALAFVNSANNSLKTVGYSLAILLGAFGLRMIWFDWLYTTGELISAIGFIIMALATVCYLIVRLLALFGFVKKTRNHASSESICLWNELTRYKEMLEDGILTEEEFSELKQKAMTGADAKEPTMDDLKKWKKLLDQQIINDEEFIAIKKNIFAK